MIHHSRSLSVAVAQSCPVPGDVQANVKEHIELAQRAAREGASIVLFPELSLTGYELALAERLAFTEVDPRLNPLREVAQAYKATLVVGAPVRIGPALHIGAFLLGVEGSLQLYTKHRLGAFPPSAVCDSVAGDVPPAESTVFEPGDRNPLLVREGLTAAVAVCADIGRPAHAELAARRGANLYLASMFVIPSDFDSDTEKLARYAGQHRMMTAFANFGSPSGGLRSAGRSTLWSESGERLIQLDEHGSGIALVTKTEHGIHARAI